ncbi:hypothetical protein ACRALDRAFT_2024983 [Sodiomyces alcalophilus JCM 7366]|uniref:uncharacterized protein n=1 Tax=Sodiomyces alcalophilus JCM 7366 TaxID=591952 RepID=UPI0039B61D7D
MGLLSFFSLRRTTGESLGVSTTSIEARAYNATPPSRAPLQGTYPVAGNGPTSALETLQRSQRSLALDDGSDDSAPAPFVPRLLEPGVERPQTAPHNARVGDTRRKLHRTRSRRDPMMLLPPVAFRKTRSRKSSIASTTHSTPDPVRRVLSTSRLRLHSSPSSVANTREASILSMNSGKGFVDLLDAQSELRQLSFHTRLRAAGARDYGEDVADRNVGENGVDLSSPRVQAFYASMNRVAAQRPSTASQSLDSSSNPVDTSAGPPSHMPILNPLTQHPVTPAEQAFLASRSRSRTEQTTRRLSETGADGSVRRQSLASYTTSSSRVLTNATTRPRTMHGPNRLASGVSEANASPAPTTSYTSLCTNADPDFDFDLRDHPVPNFSPQLSSPLPSFARDSVLLAKANYSLPPTLRTSERLPREKLSAKSSAHKDYSATSDQHLAASGVRAQSSDSRASSGRLSRPRSLRLDMPSDTLLAVSAIRHRLDPGRVLPLSSASYTMRDGHLQNHGWEEPPVTSKSLAGSIHHGRSTQDETYEETEMPIRSSSLHQWSVSSSNTPTASSISSPFLRPQSHHTADTSIDMPPVLSEKMTGYNRQVQSSSASRTEDDARSYRTALAPNVLECIATSENPFPCLNAADMDVAEADLIFDNSIVFNVDECFDSDGDVDSDSVIGGGRARGESEGHLLFRDTGYGFGGLQLPGLFDGIPSIPANTQLQDDDEGPGVSPIPSSSTPPPVLRRPRSSVVADSFGTVDHGTSWVGTSAFHDSGDEDEDEDDDGRERYSPYDHSHDEATFSDSDGVAYGPLVPVARKGSVRRFSAIGTDRDAASTTSQGGGGLDRVDVQRAVRLRKEAKAKLRADGVLTPRPGHRGRRREPSRGRTLDRNVYAW